MFKNKKKLNLSIKKIEFKEGLKFAFFQTDNRWFLSKNTYFILMKIKAIKKVVKCFTTKRS